MALDPSQAALPAAVFLEQGNRKTGISGRFFESIWVWNLPPMTTCPGKSSWCAAHCYNADPREDVFPVARWLQNLKLIEETPDEAAAQIIAFLKATPKKTAVRIHSSGDFHSIPYVEWWTRVIHACPTVRFWAYTRSWIEPGLRDALELLRDCPNLQMFASWDVTMPRPPEGWRLSIISEGSNTSKPPNLYCPEQYEGGPACVDCGYCIRKGSGNVIFHSH